jgi:Xaa-Pro dipeptidase
MVNQQTLIPQISRQKQLASLLSSAGLDGLILNPGPSLVYMIGLHFHLSERPVVVIFTPPVSPIIILPELEQQKVKQLPFELQPFTYGDDPSTWGDVFRAATQAAGLANKRIGVEPRQLRFLEYQLLSEAAPAAGFVDGAEILARLRMQKDDAELSAMRIAAQIAERALLATLPRVKVGISEHDLASELTIQLLRAGCDPEMPFSPIVSGGPNSANPHATPSERKLAEGDLLVVDWGASHTGYCSDITRTFAIGKVDPEFIKIGQVVLEANRAGRKAARPGAPADSVDRAARNIIEAAGYGRYFTHRTGHGLGMEGHEEPYIRPGNSLLLQPGMTFTVEPGIYLPGRNGVRIEDDVAITSNSSECLTSLPREVQQLL